MKKFSTFQLVVAILVICVVSVALTLIVDHKVDNKKASNVTETTKTPTATATATATITATVTPWPTPEVDVQNSYGDYYDCDPDPVDPTQSICVTYHYVITMFRQNCGNYLCPTKIEFTSEYGDGSMWIDYYDSKTSINIQSGVAIDLPSLDSLGWGIGPRSFFDVNVTPQP